MVDTTVGREAVRDPARRPTVPARTSRTGAPPPRADRPPGRRSGLLRLLDRVLAWPAWVQVLAAYAGSRVVAAVLIEVAARLVQNPAGVGDLHPDYLDMVRIWDGDWYRQIAEDGYPTHLPHAEQGNVDYNGWAFFPVFPLLVRAVMTTGLPFSAAASLVNLAAGAGAALVLWQLFRARAADRHHERLAVLAVGLWCLLPPSPVLQVAYSEAVAALLVAAFLLLLVRRRYLAAVPVVLLLGLTRAIAAPLVVVVAWHAVGRWGAQAGPGGERLPSRERWSLVALGTATASSALLWPLIVGLATGVPSAFFQTQAAWGQKPTDGPFLPWITWAWGRMGVVGVLLLLGAVAAGVQQLAGRHTAWLVDELRVFGVAYPIYLLAVVRPITSMWRFLLLDLPIAAALASGAARGGLGRTLSPRWRWRVAAAALVGLAAMGWWVAVMLTRTPWADTPP
ncbi:MAG: hypothetical protein QOH03_5548 [Kribbellaceae bacterium]|nr:hypothetical protein [Kribbellaceae bacterium]